MTDRVPVTFDDQIFTGQRWGGVSRYFTELLQQYRRLPDLGVDARTPFRFVQTDYLLGSDLGRFRTPPSRGPLRRGRAMRMLNAVGHVTPFHRPAVLHHTYYLESYLRLPAKRRVCTVYDMIPELRPDLFPTGSSHAAKEAFVRASDAVLCISQTTKDDLSRCYGPLDKPVEVTPLAVGADYYRARPVSGSVDYVLYVGRREGYKNFGLMLEAFAALAVTRPRLRLLCVGGGPFSAAEREQVAATGAGNRISQRPVADDAMAGTYADALALVFPSQYEGFGLPIVEAFAAGCPVIVADTPCSLEISGGAASVVAHDDAAALTAALDELAGDPAARSALVSAGRLRARDFSWERTARLTADVYRRVHQWQ